MKESVFFLFFLMLLLRFVKMLFLVVAGGKLCQRRLRPEPYSAHHQQRGDARLHRTETLQSPVGRHLAGEDFFLFVCLKGNIMY